MRADSVDAPSLWEQEDEDDAGLEQVGPRGELLAPVHPRGRSASVRAQGPAGQLR